MQWQHNPVRDRNSLSLIFGFALFSSAANSLADELPANWPKGHTEFECIKQNGTSERLIQAFYDDIGGNTWDKYLIAAKTPQEFQAAFVTRGQAVLNLPDHTWLRDIPGGTVDGKYLPGLTMKYILRKGADNRPYMKMIINGELFEDCKAIGP